MISQEQAEVYRKGYLGLIMMLAESAYILKDVKDENDRLALLSAIESNANDWLPSFAAEYSIKQAKSDYAVAKLKHPQYLFSDPKAFVEKLVAEFELSDTLVNESGILSPVNGVL